MMLNDKVAVIYGAGGAVAEDIVCVGGSAEAAEVDALDEQAVGRHLQSVIDKAGRFDARCATVTAAARSEELS